MTEADRVGRRVDVASGRSFESPSPPTRRESLIQRANHRSIEEAHNDEIQAVSPDPASSPDRIPALNSFSPPRVTPSAREASSVPFPHSAPQPPTPPRSPSTPPRSPPPSSSSSSSAESEDETESGTSSEEGEMPTVLRPSTAAEAGNRSKRCRARVGM